MSSFAIRRHTWAAVALPCAAASVLLPLLAGCGAGTGVPLSSPGPSTGTALALTNGPQLGYAWNGKDDTLRPILGVPGAAQFGAGVVTAKSYVNAAVAGTHAVALAGDGSMDRLSLPDGAASPLPGSAPANAEIRFSAAGTSALTFVPGSTRYLLITGIGTTPQATTGTSAQPILEAAVSDQGTAALALASGGGASVNVLAVNGTVQRVGTAASLGGLSFAGSSENLVFADAQSNTVTLVQAASSAPAASTLSTGGLLSKPVSLGTSPDARWVVVVNGADASVVRLGLASQTAPLRIPCACQPAFASPLTRNGVFRLTALGTTPVWIADAAASSPRTLFIPAFSSNQTTQTAQQSDR